MKRDAQTGVREGASLKLSGSSRRSGATKETVFSLSSQQKWPVCKRKTQGDEGLVGGR